MPKTLSPLELETPSGLCRKLAYMLYPESNIFADEYRALPERTKRLRTDALQIANWADARLNTMEAAIDA